MTKTSCSVCKSSEHQTCVVRLYYATDWTCRATSSVVVVVAVGESFCCVRQTNKTERESKKVFRKVAPAWRCPYKRKAFLNADSPFLCNDPPKRDIAVTHSWVPVQVAQTSSTSPKSPKQTRAQWSLNNPDLRWPLTLSSAHRVGSIFYHASPHAEQWIPKRLGLVQAQPKKWSSQSWWEEKNVKKGGEKDKKRWPILEAALRSNSDGVLRLATGRHRLCCTCTCSRGRWEWPGGGRGRQLAGAGRSQQRSPQPAFCAR